MSVRALRFRLFAKFKLFDTRRAVRSARHFAAIPNANAVSDVSYSAFGRLSRPDCTPFKNYHPIPNT